MAIPTLSFVVGSLAICYLLTFVVFAVIRVFTGVSIQRLGLSSLRHISYAPRDGLKIEIRGLGLWIHRPSFAQPTWLSLVVQELKVTIDLSVLGAAAQKEQTSDVTVTPEPNGRPKLRTRLSSAWSGTKKSKKGRSMIWAKLTEVKNKIKRLHRIVSWLRLIDLIAHRSSCVFSGVGSFQFGTFAVSVDTRPAMVDRSRLFQHNKSRTVERWPAEWTLMLRKVLFTPEGKEGIEILDHIVLTVHGYLRPEVEGLRDASVSLKAGRLRIPYSEITDSFISVKRARAARNNNLERRNSLAVDNPDSAPDSDGEEATVPRVLLDAGDFVASTLRGILEVTVAVGFLGISQRVESVHPAGMALYLNASMNEVGMDFYRLDPTTPAHSMYFARGEVAHQALISTISISVGIDAGHDHPDRILYVPMATATIRTTLPGKLLQFTTEEGSLDLNSNVFYANLVVTSPSIDLDPAHLPVVLATFQTSTKRGRTSKVKSRSPFASRLLPKASIRLSVHEPVIRVSLPPVEARKPDDFDFDLLISAVSSLSLDIDSEHNSASDTKYNVSAIVRSAAQRLYYQTTSRETHDLLVSDSMEIKTHITSDPQVLVVSSATFQTLSIVMTRPEIVEGIRQIVHQLRSDVKSERLNHPRTHREPNFIRALPSWLHHFDLHASDLNVEIAGVDPQLSSQSRGFALHLNTWTADYKMNKDDAPRKAFQRRRGGSQSVLSGTDPLRSTSPLSKHRSVNAECSDGRRLAIHFKGFEGFIVESANTWEQEPCISVPRAEVAFTTSNDGQGSLLHIHSTLKAIYLQYSLFRHYAIGVGVMTIRKALSRSGSVVSSKRASDGANMSSKGGNLISIEEAKSQKEFFSIDVNIGLAQVKAQLPDDPNTMVHFTHVEASRHRFHTPFVRADAARLFATSPSIKSCWTRVVSIKSPRLDLRQSRRKHGNVIIVEKSYDVVADMIRVGVPYQLVVHMMFDNFVNAAKTAAQLHHRFETESDEYILAKEPEGPKNVPRITLRTQIFLLEIEDGPFEWKLGAIFRTGLIEQKQRLAREEAFEFKCRALRNGPSKISRPNFRSHSRKNVGGNKARSKSHESHDERQRTPSPTSGRRSASQDRPRGRSMRYDKDGSHGISRFAQTNIEEARRRLNRYNAQSWRKRIDNAKKYHKGAVQDIRHLLWGMEDSPEPGEMTENILHIPQRPALAAILMSDLTMIIDKPSFPLQQLPDFMHRVGKGLPKDTLFSLLIPLNAQFDVGELRATVRDYPLPLLHIPAIKPGQSAKLPSFSLKTDFVIGEEFRDAESTRDLPIQVIPADLMAKDDKSQGGFAVDVRRTVSPVKTYSDIKLDINTARDTRVSWGTSFQPAIQDIMQVIEGFTKPQVDPSDKVGFWDKIRLSFHSRVQVAWKGGGDVHFVLKGSRDPYVVTGHGAGFIMIWRNNVRWAIWQEDDPRKFMTVDSGDFVLAIPDFTKYARRSPDMLGPQAKANERGHQEDTQKFKKVIMKLSGKVSWLIGLVFERDIVNGKRSFDFEPHYNVTLKNPTHLKDAKQSKEYDAFHGFRSNHIHMSIGVSAPSDREWTVSNLEPASNYNAVHLTPRFFTHFFSWWDLFSGIMSLPIRQGPLFPAAEKSGKKFGRHLATIKYALLLSPLFISHVYLHKDGDEWTEDVVSATGLKMRLDSFMLDMHQRREEFTSEVKGRQDKLTTTGMRISQALLDLIRADMRAVSVGISGTSAETIRKATPEQLLDINARDQRPVDISTFNIPDSDLSWVDVDDFVEVDWSLPYNHDPKTSILPLAFAPRFTYRRQTDHGNTISGDSNRHSPFGYEETHYCVMSDANDSRRVQMDMIKKRLVQINDLLEEHNRDMGDLELHAVREADESAKEVMEKQLKEFREHGESFERKKLYLGRMVLDLQRRVDNHHKQPTDSETTSDMPQEEFEQDPRQSHDPATYANDSRLLTDHVSDFNNRFVVHDAQIKWNNSLRNTMLRYIHQVSQRRGFVYYTSRRAVKFILDIIEERQKASRQQSYESKQGSGSESPRSPAEDDDELDVQDRIEQLLRDGQAFVNADDPEGADGGLGRRSTTAHDTNDDVSHDFVPQNAYHVRLVAPQIQLQSEKNPRAVVLVATRGVRLQIFQIMDKDRVSDEVSGLVQTRYTMEMDNMQFFVTTKQLFATNHLKIYAGNEYGTTSGSQWPPWAPMEAMFDFHAHTYGFDRVVQRTSATLRYDKYNKLRLKYNDSVTEGKDGVHDNAESFEDRMDHIWVEFPQLRALCDSSQYFAMYIIVLDLLMWSEPLEKTRNERLEKIMLASDFSDLRGAPQMVERLQSRIRALDDIKTHFHLNEKYLDQQGWQDRIAMEQDLASCEDELFFIMKAITTAQRKTDERAEAAQASGVLRYLISASEIVWHLIKEAGQPLAEFQLRRANFERTDNSDGSNHNMVDVDQIKGLSLLPNTIYPETIAAYNEHPGTHGRDGHSRMLRVKWYQLEAIAGIKLVDHFEANLHPLKIQLDYETGHKLFEYIFPGAGQGDEGFSPFLVRNKFPQTEEENGQNGGDGESVHDFTTQATKDHLAGSATGAGSLENRLQPTRALPDYNRNPAPTKSKHHGLGINIGEHRFRHLHRGHSSASLKNLKARASTDNLSLSGGGRVDDSRGDTSTRKRFGSKRTPRSSSVDSKRSKTVSIKTDSDDLSQMLSRASNYMTLSYVKVPSVILCLSYKGKGSRNVEDVHNLVFRMPTLEYRNKTWSNLDLALALKKDVIRALISHTGAIIGNKFSHHKYGKSQQSRLRELASSSVVLSSNDISRVPSASSSVRHLPGSRADTETDASPRISDVTDANYGDDLHFDDLMHTDSFASGLSDMSSIRASTRSIVDSDDEELEDQGERGTNPHANAKWDLRLRAATSEIAGERPQTPESSVGNKRSVFARGFSELTGLAKRRNSGAGTDAEGWTNGSGSGHEHGSGDGNAGEDATSATGSGSVKRRDTLVKKLFASLDR